MNMDKEMMDCYDPHLLIEITKDNSFKKYTNLDKKDKNEYKKLQLQANVVERIQKGIGSDEEEQKFRTLALYEYSIGAYHEAVDKFFFLRKSRNAKTKRDALWGKLSCEILLKNFKAGEQDLEGLIKEIEEEKDQEVALRDRVVLCHWVLFFPVQVQLDLFFKPAYMNAIQIMAPWLLKYVVVTVIVSKRNIKELARILSCEKSVINSIVGFFEAIYTNLQVTVASEKLKEIKTIEKDYFFNKNREKFLENCQTIIFEVLVKTHSKISTEKLGSLMILSLQQVQNCVLEYQKDHSSIEFDGKYVSIKRRKTLTVGDAIDRLNQFKKNGLVQGSIEVDDSFVGPKYAII